MKARPRTPYRKSETGNGRAVSVTSLTETTAPGKKAATGQEKSGQGKPGRGNSGAGKSNAGKSNAVNSKGGSGAGARPRAQGKPAKRSRLSSRPDSADPPHADRSRAREPVVSFTEWSARRRRRRRRIVGGVAALVVVFVVLAAVAYLTPVLAVDKVAVTGTSVMSDRSVTRLVSGQVKGTPLPRVSDHDVAQSVLDKFPVAKHVEVSKSLPRTIKVVVTERVPVAATGTPGDYQLIDDDGVTVRTSATVPKGVPTLEIDVDRAGAGAVRAALSAMDALPKGVADKVASVSARSATSVEFTLHSGLKIRWGDGHNGKLKAKVLGMLMKTDARYINVSVPKEPTTK